MKGGGLFCKERERGDFGGWVVEGNELLEVNSEASKTVHKSIYIMYVYYALGDYIF